MIKKTLKVNGVVRNLILDQDETLAKVLREHLLLTGCKIGCGQGHCGACNVIVNGEIKKACIWKMSKIPDNAEITTIEGVGTLKDMHPIQVAWMAFGGAQCGFCTPGFIISAKVLLEKNPNPTRQEVVDWFQKQQNLCRCTGYKPLVDATMAAAAVMRGEMSKEDLIFKQTEDSIMGTKYIRPSAAQKVTGTWDFGADDALKMPEGTLRLALTQAKVSHANIKSVDISEAEKMPGVEKVILAKDIKAAGGTNQINGLVMLPKYNKTDGFERPVLCEDKIFQFGDAIAIVAADTEAHARAAADAVKVEIEELPAYMNALDAKAPDAIEIHPGTPNVFYETNCIKGPDFDWDSVPEKQMVDVESYCSRQPHLHLEPDCGYGYYDEDGMLTIHSKSIGIHLHMPMIAAAIGEPTMEKLRLVQNHAGGTFGYKFSPTNEALIGAAVKVTGKPCSLVFNQFQNITYTGKRSPAFMHIKMACDANGKLQALWGDNYVDHGPYSEFGDLLTMRLSQFTGAGYGINSIRNKSQTVFTNHAWGSAFRAYGSPQSFMGSEIAIDILAAKMGIDPFEMRAMNCYKESEQTTIPTGYPPEVYCEEALFAKARPIYEDAKKVAAEKNAKSDGRYKYGVGVSLGVYGCGLDGVDTSNAYAELNPDGTVTMYSAWEDHGQGADMGVLVSAHETLRQAGIKPEQIKLVMNDTKTCPNAGPAGGSRSQCMSGNACRLAAEALVAEMKKDDGTYRTYDEMVKDGKKLKVEGNWATTYCADHPINEDTAQGEPFATYMYTIFMPSVEVDTETGKVHVYRFDCVADVGTIMNRLLVEGNFYGGLLQGVGLALTEDFDDLSKETTLKGCGIPYPKDAPEEVNLYFNETYRPSGPYGAAGCGEAPLDAPHPAILNAIYAATGARITRIPARPDKVLAALKALK